MSDDQLERVIIRTIVEEAEQIIRERHDELARAIRNEIADAFNG